MNELTRLCAPVSTTPGFEFIWPGPVVATFLLLQCLARHPSGMIRLSFIHNTFAEAAISAAAATSTISSATA
eukprot:4660622-Karenia_brevis.AAC.1